MKKIVLALAFVLLGSFMLSGCSKDEILDHYNSIVQSAGAIELTGKLSLEGTKEKGIDDYTGTYTADYENFSDTEYLFGGTSIKREKPVRSCLLTALWRLRKVLQKYFGFLDRMKQSL